VGHGDDLVAQGDHRADRDLATPGGLLGGGQRPAHEADLHLAVAGVGSARKPGPLSASASGSSDRGAALVNVMVIVGG